MSLTLEEVKARLKTLDELTLLELFDLSSEELVEHYEELIEENFEFYNEQVASQDDSAT